MESRAERPLESGTAPRSSLSRVSREFLPVPSIYVDHLAQINESASTSTSISNEWQLATAVAYGSTHRILTGQYALQAALDKADRTTRSVGAGGRVKRKIVKRGSDEGSEDSLSDDGRNESIKLRLKLGALAKERSQEKAIPAFVIPEIEVPRFYPSGSLFSAIHQHASDMFTGTNEILPTLDRRRSTYSPAILDHISRVQSSLESLESDVCQELASSSSLKPPRKAWLQWKSRNWAHVRLKEGLRKDCWRDVDRKFEGSALIAVGMLAQLLAVHAVAGDLGSHSSQSDSLDTSDEDVAMSVDWDASDIATEGMLDQGGKAAVRDDEE